MGSNPITYSDLLGLDIGLIGDFGQAPHILMGFNLLLRTPSYKAEFSQYVSIPGEGVFEFAGHEFYTAGMLKEGLKIIEVGPMWPYNKIAFAAVTKVDKDVTSWSKYSNNWDFIKKVLLKYADDVGKYSESDFVIDIAIVILHEEEHNRLFEDIVASLNDPKEANRLYRKYKEQENPGQGADLHRSIAKDTERWKAVREKYEPQLVDAVLDKYPQFTRKEAEGKVLEGFRRHQKLTAGENRIRISNPLAPNPR